MDIRQKQDVKFVKRNNLVVSLDLEKEDMKRLRMLANKKGVGLTDLITHWIKEQLRSV